jgi:hypothetical protein
MQYYATVRPLYMDILLQSEGRRNISVCSACHSLLSSTSDLYSCSDCLGKPQLCLHCVGSGHRLRPFHRIRRWNGSYFESSTLNELGFELHLGHEGWPCPRAQDEHVPDEYTHPPDHYDSTWVNAPLDDGRTRNSKVIVVGHSNGYHRIKMVPCMCPNSRPVWQQMLRRGLWPATYSFPETVFTTECLDLGRSLHLECKTSISGYHTLLEQQTCFPFGQTIPVCLQDRDERVSHYFR